MQSLICCRCSKPATIGEHDDAIGSFLACSDECHAAELAARTAGYQDDVAGVYQRKRERIAAIKAGEIEHPGFVGIDPDAPGGDEFTVVVVEGVQPLALIDSLADRSKSLQPLNLGPASTVQSPLDMALARIERRGAQRIDQTASDAG